jgi:uncharacterized protein (DUF433 family)
MMGKPVSAGTRVPVETVVRQFEWDELIESDLEAARSMMRPIT